MSQSSLVEEFAGIVIQNLEKNGFPHSVVTLPMEKLYEAASKRGFSFNKVRDILRTKGIESELSGERIVFTSPVQSAEEPSLSDMAAAAQQIFANMSEEQRNQLNQLIENLAPEEIEKMQHQFEAMSPEEKARLLGQVKNGGL